MDLVLHRSHAIGILASACLLAALSIVMSAKPVLACTNEAPIRPLATLVAKAHYIVDATRVKEGDRGALTIAWRRVLMTQDAPERIAVPPQPLGCPYPWGLPTDDQRAVMLIADGPGGLTVTDVWLADHAGRLLTPIHHEEVATPPRTIDALLRYLVALAPDTSTADPPTPTGSGGPAIAILAVMCGAIAGAWAFLRPRQAVVAG
jgi:hypothetical protein